MKPLNSGPLWVLKNLSAIGCPLLGGSLTKIVRFGTEHLACYSKHVHDLGCPLLGGFIVSCKPMSDEFKTHPRCINYNPMI